MRVKKELHRDPDNARIAGVCAGVAEYFGLETWLVRILTVTGFFLLAGPFMLVAYVAAWFILDKKPGSTGSKKKHAFTNPEASPDHASQEFHTRRVQNETKHHGREK